MPDNPILVSMLDRLYASLVRGPSLNARPHNSRQRLDLTLLKRLEDESASAVLTHLLGDAQKIELHANVKMPPGYQEGRFRKKDFRAAPRVNFDETTQSDDAQTPKEEPEADSAEVKAYRAQKSLLNKLRNLSDDAKTYEQDTGVSVLTVGYPILSLPPGTTGGGSKRILAPLAMIPINLEVRTGARAGVTLSCREDGLDRVQPNNALLAWLERETQHEIPDDLFSDEDGEKPLDEIAALIELVTRMLNLQEIDATAFTEPGFASLAPLPKSDELGDAPAVLHSAVLGLFPVSNQGLMRDMRHMIKEPKLHGPVCPFIDSNASLATTEHDAEDAKPIEQYQTRRFDEERFVARADPCQSETVYRARTESGVVIHGPPGTGKSQTITNIIGDYLAAEKRVLFVCDKRTALDVVYNRLEHLGLGRLCALIHDPQRDQKDLYMSIRSRLEELTDLRTHPRAESSINKIDQELQSIHDELTHLHSALMTEDGEQTSFHEMMGQWLSIDAPMVDGIDEETLASTSIEQLNAVRGEIEIILNRAQAVTLPDNPWMQCAGPTLDEYMQRVPDEMRRQFAGCLEDARAVDSTSHETIPPLSNEQSLDAQSDQRAALAKDLQWIAENTQPEMRKQVSAWPLETTKARAKLTIDAEPSQQVLEQGPLNAELWMTVRDDPPTMRSLAQQLGELEAYLQAIASFFGFLKFGAKKRGKKLLQTYGLSSSEEDAEKLKQFLTGLRARLVLSEVYFKLVHEADRIDQSPPQIADEQLLQSMTCYRRILQATVQADKDDRLAALWRQALADDQSQVRLIEGLQLSPARCSALQQLEQSLETIKLFSDSWLKSISQQLRSGKCFVTAMTRLQETFDDLESVLRIRHDLKQLSATLGETVKKIAVEGVGAEKGIAVIERGVLGAVLLQRVQKDRTLRSIDPDRIARHFDRYMKLEDDKRRYVADAILHKWTEKQKERLLVGTRSRLNSDGSGLRNRLFVRGRRAMRLRQVIQVGQTLENGDPLYDMCPVWLASPETVAQIFPRQELFDVVIFDEASQCRLEEALPVLTRGKRVVIAGDPKQLPPTRFFEAAVTTSDDSPIEDERDVFEAQQSEVEDLLAAALNLEVQESYLDVHYRSRNADLIGFSNTQFYHSRLQPIPGHPHNIAQTPPIELIRAEGIYEERANELEAQRVCDLIDDLLAQDNPPSIGVATFNLVQRDLIAEMLDERASEDSTFSRKLSVARKRRGEGSFEGLFIKNLENVQGDERDHIIISTTFGPTPEGKFYKRFGPLRMAGGGRRLNVLVTRARMKVHLVTSIPREQYNSYNPIPEGAKPNGAWLLFAYLRYAELLEEVYQNREADRNQLQTDENNPDTTVMQRLVDIDPSSRFAQTLSLQLAQERKIGSEAHWGNAGFCIDASLQHATRPDGVTLGVLTDFNRFRYATDPVAWEVYRSAILLSQGWQLHRVWSPVYLRDATRVLNGIANEHEQAMTNQPST